MIGTIINGKYRIVSILGRGGMGAVYRAEQFDVKGRPFREVALKLLLPEHSESPAVVDRLLREVQISALLEGPRMVTVYDSGRAEDGQLYFTMNLINGDTLRQTLTCGPLPIQRTLAIGGQICDALKEMHDRSNPIIHRDLKPDNIFLERRQGQEWVRIGDFGLAKILSLEDLTDLTQAATLGTPAYMAPEQWTGEEVNARTDLYALGIILYELLTGRRPFLGGKNHPPLREQHLHLMPPSLPETIPANVRSLVERLLAKAPNSRPTDSMAVKRMLEQTQEPSYPPSLPLTSDPALHPIIDDKTRLQPPKRNVRQELVAFALEQLRRLPHVWKFTGMIIGSFLILWVVAIRGKEGVNDFPATSSQGVGDKTLHEAEAKQENGDIQKQQEKRGQQEFAAALKAEQESERKRFAEKAALRKALDERNRMDEMVTVPADSSSIECINEVGKECSDEEKSRQKETVGTFKIDKTEVTVTSYQQCLTADKCTEPRSGDDCNWNVSGRDNYPINCVDWNQAGAYCEWVGKRLPTVAEWERAARGTDGRIYPWGNRGWDDAGRVANIADETIKRSSPTWDTIVGYDDGFFGTAPVGSFPAGASPYGALDMIGNVWEWTADLDKEELKFNITAYFVRGGSWRTGLERSSVSYDYSRRPGYREVDGGFRCAQ